MKTKLIALVLGLTLCLTSGFAASITVTVGGDTYNLTTIEGSFDANAAVLTSQVWWHNDALATAIISAVQGGLGYPIVGSGNLSPFMAISDTMFADPNYIYTTMWRESDSSELHLAIGRTETQIFSGRIPSPVTWIVAGGAVPETGATLGYFGLAAGLLLLRRKVSRVAS